MGATAESMIKERIVQALQVSKKQLEEKNQKANFVRIIMRFPKINAVFKQIRDMHKKYDTSGDGEISMTEYKAAVSDMLNAGKDGANPISSELADKAFSMSDFEGEGEKQLDEKEFIVMCVIGFILAQDSGNVATIGGMMASSDAAYHSAMMDVLTAYLTFDRDCKGYFTRDEFDGFMKASKRAPAATGIFTEDRWKELDITGDGQVDFEEFVYAFSQWVGANDDDEEDDVEEDVKKPNPIKQRILLALKLMKERLDKEGKKTNFTRISLRFPKINKVFERIRDIHGKYDTDGGGHIDLSELNSALSEMMNSGNEEEDAVDKEQIENLFMLSDLGSEGDEEGLDVKEFIVLIVVGFMLEEAGGRTAKTISGHMSLNDAEYRKAMMDILSAYLAFDKEGKGFFTSDEAIGALSSKAEGGTIMTPERWEEMDNDKSGEVEFEEFVFAFSQWVSPDDDDDDDDEE